MIRLNLIFLLLHPLAKLDGYGVRSRAQASEVKTVAHHDLSNVSRTDRKEIRAVAPFLLSLLISRISVCAQIYYSGIIIVSKTYTNLVLSPRIDMQIIFSND